MKLKKILVANRGEIALRIIKTIKEMGLEAVAMYVESDKDSVYVQNSDPVSYTHLRAHETV